VLFIRNAQKLKEAAVTLKLGYFNNRKSYCLMASLFKISLFHFCLNHALLTPLSVLWNFLKTYTRATTDYGLLFAIVNGAKDINIPNSLLINNVKKSAFFAYFYFVAY
jgi:hypothetical protein